MSVHIAARSSTLVRHGGTKPAVEQVTRCIQRLKYRNINSEFVISQRIQPSSYRDIIKVLVDKLLTKSEHSVHELSPLRHRGLHQAEAMDSLDLAGGDGALLVVVGQHAGHYSYSLNGGTKPKNIQQRNLSCKNCKCKDYLPGQGGVKEATAKEVS